jgi:predicted Fe-S protein YdhL (DUF1289 family)
MCAHNVTNPTENQLVSPCIRVCCLDDHDICLGCFRSLTEIKRWTQVDEATRQNFLANAKDREQHYRQKWGSE